MSERLSRQNTLKKLNRKDYSNQKSGKKASDTYNLFEEKSRSNHERRSYSAPNTVSIQRSIYKALFPAGNSKSNFETLSGGKDKRLKQHNDKNEKEESRQEMPHSLRRFLNRVNSGYGEKMMEQLEKPHRLEQKKCSKTFEKIKRQPQINCEKEKSDQDEKCFSDLMLEFIHRKIAEEETLKTEHSPENSYDRPPIPRNTLPSLHGGQIKHFNERSDQRDRKNAARINHSSNGKFHETKRIKTNSLSEEPGGSDWKIKKLKEVQKMRLHADKEAKMNVDKWCRLKVDYMEQSRQKARKEYLTSLTKPDKSSISMDRIRQKQIEMIQKSYILNNIVPKGSGDGNGGAQEPSCVLEKDMEALIRSIPIGSELKTGNQAPQDFGNFSTDSSENEEEERSKMSGSEEDNCQEAEKNSSAVDQAISLKYEPETLSTRVDEYLRSYKAQVLDRQQVFQKNERKLTNKNYNKSHTSEIISKLAIGRNDPNEITDSREKNEKRSNDQSKPFVYNTALPRQPWDNAILEDCRVVYTKQIQPTRSQTQNSTRAVSPIAKRSTSHNSKRGNLFSPRSMSPRKSDGGRPTIKSVNLRNLPKHNDNATAFTRSTSNVDVVPPIKPSKSSCDHKLDEKIGILKIKEFPHLEPVKRQSYRKDQISNQQSTNASECSQSKSFKRKKRVTFLDDNDDYSKDCKIDEQTEIEDTHTNDASMGSTRKKVSSRKQQNAPEYDDEYGDPGGNNYMPRRQDSDEPCNNLEYDNLNDLKKKASTNFDRRFGFF